MRRHREARSAAANGGRRAASASRANSGGDEARARLAADRAWRDSGTRAPRPRGGRRSEPSTRRAAGKVARCAPRAAGRVTGLAVAVRPRLSYDAGAPGSDPRTPVSQRRAASAPRGTRARHPTVPRAPLRPRGRRGLGAARRAAVRRHRPGAPPEAARAPPAERRAPRPAARRARRGPRRALPAGRPHARGVALGRDACARIPSPPSTCTSRPTACRAPTVERTQRGFFARLRIEPFGPGSGVLPHERTLSGPREDRYRLLRATGINTSPGGRAVRGSGRRGRRAAGGGRRGDPPAADVVDDDGVRHRLWAVAGRRRSAGDGRDAGRGRRRAARVHRGRSPPLRDRGPLPGRAAGDALRRAGPVLRLPADAVPRRRGRADRAADPPRRARPGRRTGSPAARRPARACSPSTPATTEALVERFGAAGELRGRRGPVRPGDARRGVAARRPAGPRSPSCSAPAASALRALDVSLLGRRARDAGRDRRCRRRRRRADRLHEVGRRGGGAGRRRARTARMPRSCSSPRPSPRSSRSRATAT